MKCPEFSPNFSFSCCRSSIPKKLNGILSADNILWSALIFDLWGMLYLASYQFPNTKSIDNCKWSSLHRLDLLSQWVTYRCASLLHLPSCNCRSIFQQLSHPSKGTAYDSLPATIAFWEGSPGLKESGRIWVTAAWILCSYWDQLIHVSCSSIQERSQRIFSAAQIFCCNCPSA